MGPPLAGQAAGGSVAGRCDCRGGSRCAAGVVSQFVGVGCWRIRGHRPDGEPLLSTASKRSSARPRRQDALGISRQSRRPRLVRDRGSRIVGFRFGNVCPSDSRAGTLVPTMVLRHGASHSRRRVLIHGVVHEWRERHRPGRHWGLFQCPAGWRLIAPLGRRLDLRQELTGGDNGQCRGGRDGIEYASPGASSPTSLIGEVRGIRIRQRWRREGQLHDRLRHKLHAGPCTAKDRMEHAGGWSEDVAYQHFLTDVQQLGTDCVNRYVQVPLTQDQFDALSTSVQRRCDALNPRCTHSPAC